MEFRILGPLEAFEGERPVPLPTGRGRALLALLVLNAGKVVSVDRLIDSLWGETVPATVRTALHGLVSDLRTRLEPARRRGDAATFLRTSPPGYVLAVPPTCVDADRFRRLVAEARASKAVERVVKLREALGLWRGSALADFRYEPFAQQEIAALEELRLAALEDRIDAELALGLASQLVAEMEALVTEHPTRERLLGQLMLALYRSGRQAEALEVYRRAAKAPGGSRYRARPTPATAGAGDPSAGRRSRAGAIRRASGGAGVDVDWRAVAPGGTEDSHGRVS
jgi:DNA-binding SARP family transcriptional activator